MPTWRPGQVSPRAKGAEPLLPSETIPEDSDYLLVFDGGSRNDAGFGYGSYRISSADGRSRLVRLEFGHGITSNQAEYMTLIAGLRDLLSTIDAAGRPPTDFSLEVWGDSKLVINQLQGRWKVRSRRLAPLHAEARRLLGALGCFRLVWTPRVHSVAVLGH